MTINLPTIIGPEGPQPQTPDVIRAEIVARATELAPGLTTNLPGSLIEDVASTSTGAAMLCDQAKVDAINSLTVLGANDFSVAQLGVIYGIPQGAAANTSVLLLFTGTPGLVIPRGFTVSDGSFQYVVQDGGIISPPPGGGNTGQSDLIFAVSPTPGSWAVPPNTVTQFATGVAVGYSLSVTNPQAGIPSSAAETYESYRARVVEAGQAVAQGLGTFLKAQLKKVPGVISRLVSVRLKTGVGYEVLCGGGDPYQVAYAIFTSLFDLTTLTGSKISITGATKAAAAVITTDLNHGLTNGQTGVVISGALGMTGINGTWTVTVLTEKTFSIPYNSTSAPTYTGGGVLATNARNVTVNVIDPPDTYAITYVSPPQQVVTMTVTWNTNATNVVDPAAIAQEAQPALVQYINSLLVGDVINLFELQTVFQAAVSDLIPAQNLTRMVFDVFINAVETVPSAGTGIIAGDPESYFLAALSGITVNQG